MQTVLRPRRTTLTHWPLLQQEHSSAVAKYQQAHQCRRSVCGDNSACRSQYAGYKRNQASGTKRSAIVSCPPSTWASQARRGNGHSHKRMKPRTAPGRNVTPLPQAEHEAVNRIALRSKFVDGARARRSLLRGTSAWQVGQQGMFRGLTFELNSPRRQAP